MILGNRFLLVIGLAVLTPVILGASDTHDFEVNKTDGTVSHYELLPIHYEPLHAQITQNRLMLASGFSDLSLPSNYQISHNRLPAVRDQGQRSSCAYFATIGVLETYYLAQSSQNSGLTLSEECLLDVRDWIFDQGKNYKGTDQPGYRPDPNGDFPTSIIQTVQTNGVPLANKFNAIANCTYDGNATNGSDLPLTDYLKTFSDSVSASPAYGKGLVFDQNTKPTIDMLKTLILKNLPVEVAIVIYPEFSNGSDWRFNPATDNNAAVQGGHAIMLTGYENQNGKAIFTFKNSWGENWGDSGYGTIDEDTLAQSWAYDPGYDFIVSLH